MGDVVNMNGEALNGAVQDNKPPELIRACQCEAVTWKLHLDGQIACAECSESPKTGKWVDG